MNAHKQPTIITPRLTLLCCTRPILDAIFKGDDFLSGYLDIVIPTTWTEFGEVAFRWTNDQLSNPGANSAWFSYLPILNEENALAGSCGYKGEPKDGVVEIGYEVAAVFRGRGIATEIAKALIDKALTYQEVTTVRAHTLAEENASVAVLKKNGMMFTSAISDPEDGDIWQWNLSRSGAPAPGPGG